jgi:polysaccharide pyruvyl transferase WcaK-like protein
MKIFVEDGVVLPRTIFSALKGTNFFCLVYHHRAKGIAREVQANQ